MQPIKAYCLGWKALFKSKIMWLFLFTANFLFALIVALPIKTLFNSAAANSLSINESLNRFDFTFLSDILNQYNMSIPIISNQLIMVIALYLLFSILLSGGIIYVFYLNDKFSFGNFGKGSFKFFWRYLRLSIYFLVIQSLLIYGAYKCYVIFSGGLNPFEMESDSSLISAFKIVAPIYMLLFIIVKLIQDLIKIEIIKSDETLLIKPIMSALNTIAKNFFSFLLLYLLNVIVAIGFFAFYFLIKNLFPISSQTVLPLFILSQLFILCRIALKLVNYKSAVELFKAKVEEL